MYHFCLIVCTNIELQTEYSERKASWTQSVCKREQDKVRTTCAGQQSRKICGKQ